MILKDNDLAAEVVGRTLYHRLPPGSPQGEGLAAFYFATDGRAVARLPGGKLMRGTYVIEHDGYRIDWDGGLQNSRSSLSRQSDGAYACRNIETGALRSTVVKIEDGDPERIGE